jgi:hypothetical protein
MGADKVRPWDLPASKVIVKQRGWKTRHERTFALVKSIKFSAYFDVLVSAVELAPALPSKTF